MSMRSVNAVFCCVFAMTLFSAAAAESAPLGLVLSGGGAKGAYEVGVWQELQSAGLSSNVTAISGTSVGALNAALFATRPDAAERIWLEKMEDIFTINTNRVGESIQKTVNDVSNAVDVAKNTGKRWKGVVAFLLASAVRAADDYVGTVESTAPVTGYIDSTKLAAAVDDALPKAWPPATPAVYATAVEKGGAKASMTWRLNPEPHERRVLMLRASAAIPRGFDTVEIDGKTYVDGGWESKGGDNAPLEPILENHPDVKTVIVVYLDDKKHINEKRLEKNRQAAEAAGVRLVEIVPSENIGGALGGWKGVFDASPTTARRLIELGRNDARRRLLNLSATYSPTSWASSRSR